MTEELPHGWLLLSRGLYWMPKGKGYTGLKELAGRHSWAEATAKVDGNAAEVVMIHESKAATFAPECWADVKERKIEEYLAAKDSEIARPREELAFWTNRDNHRRPTIDEARAKYGKDPTVAFRCGSVVFDAGPGHALSPVELKFIEYSLAATRSAQAEKPTKPAKRKTRRK